MNAKCGSIHIFGVSNNIAGAAEPSAKTPQVLFNADTTTDSGSPRHGFRPARFPVANAATHDTNADTTDSGSPRQGFRPARSRVANAATHDTNADTTTDSGSPRHGFRLARSPVANAAAHDTNADTTTAKVAVI